MSNNKLHYLKDFREILLNYKVSDSWKKVLEKTELAMLVGPTSAGKNTLVNKLLKTGYYHWVVSDTTRKPRENEGVMEQNGVEYWFKTEEEVLEDLRSGKFLEAAIIHEQQVSGTSLNELKKASDQGLIALHELEVSGVHNIMKLKPDAKPFFIVPPSFDEWIRRLNNRGKLSEDEKVRRIRTAANEFKVALERNYYTFVVNDNVEDAIEQIQKHTVKNQNDPEHDAKGRKVAETLLESTQDFLSGV